MFSPAGVQAKAPYVDDCFGEESGSECLEDDEPTLVDGSDNSGQTVLSSEGNKESLALNITKTLFTLLFILILIYLLIKFLSKRNKLFNQVKALENLGGISLGQSKSIQIVRIGGKVFMIGVGDNVELLQEIDDTEIIEDLLHKHEENEFHVKKFIPLIFKDKSHKVEGLNNDSQTKFKNLFTNELENLKENRLKIKNHQKKKED